ncbi:MAG TPA: aldehyde dehydrogenase [Thiotrichaceae bacterium]|jgi:acyl-CoA reductase-like NAD-dependent aldehyde dehydrogenase|nr:aldehyde dehydrogenase [Thiotrichaceae bacterium]HIM08016.1 aldehyde dehydrogenase [Gammaproteobacteria bacterium]
MSNNPNGALHQKEYGHLINGAWVAGDSGKTIDLLNPFNGEKLSQIAAGNSKDVNAAVDAASNAFPEWSQSSPNQRQEILFEIARRLKVRLNDYAMLETLNNGKPLRESLHFDIPQAINQFELFAGAAFHLHGQSFDYPDAIGLVHREPIGVCAQIIPWNVPMIMMACKIAPALAAGNTIVMKPAETVCLSVMEFFREMSDIIPPGVVNIISGYGPDVGETLITHPDVRKVAFTGSIPTAQKVMQYASKNIIPQTLELGGKSAQIVCDDADIDAAVEGATMSTVLNKGEVCLAGSRLFLHETIQDEFLEKFKTALENIRLGDPSDIATQMGPQASVMQRDKVCSYLELGAEEGASILTGGQRASGVGLDDGNFIQPTIFTNVTNDMRIAQEEIFGPVTCVIPWKEDDDVMRLANESNYGLAGGVWTTNLARAHKISRSMQTGTVWINRYYNLKSAMPLGGYKQSGFGREFCFDVLNHYTITKSVVINLQEGAMGMYDQ